MSESQPDGVVVKVAEWKDLQPGLLGGADAVFGVGMGAVQPFELDRVAVEVGQACQEAVAVVVCEAQLRAGMRTLAAGDHAGALGPPAQRQAVGDLGDPRALALLAVLADRRPRRHFGQLEDRCADGRDEVIAHEDVDPRGT
jgi:hypothetical protein